MYFCAHILSCRRINVVLILLPRVQLLMLHQTPPPGRGDRLISAGCWLIQRGGSWNSQPLAVSARLTRAAVPSNGAGASDELAWLFQHPHR